MGKHSTKPSPVRRLPLLLTAAVVVALALVASLIVIAGRGDRSAEVASDVGSPSATPSAQRSPGVDRRSDRRQLAQDPSATKKPAGPHGKRKKQPAYQVVPSNRPIRRYTRQELAAIAERKAAQLAAPKKSTLRIASLNVLGSNHAKNGLSRSARESSLLEDRGIDIVGLQEVQRDQRQVYLRDMGGYTMWPQDAVGRDGYRLQILWRSSRFEMIDGGSVNAPFDHMSVPLPYVLLRDRSSGAEFWVVDSHQSPQGLQGERNDGTVVQEDLVNRLNDTHPVLMVGDMNEHESWFCRFASRVPAWSANGGYYSGGCHPPGRPVRIDWIVGSATGENDIDFSGYTQDRTTISSGMSDHYLIYADATVSDKAPVGASTDTSAGGSSD